MTQAPPRPDIETDTEMGGRGLFMIGAIGGFFVVLALAFAVLIARSGSPDYTVELVQERTEAATAGEGVSALTLIGTEFAYEPMDSSILMGGTLTLDNQGSIIHNIEIEGVSGFLVEADAGQSASGIVDAPVGNYTIFCSIAGHREAGMVGTLSVVEP